MITIKNVSKTYGGSFKAVDDLTLAVEPGGVHGFLGPNGAGKTTTIKMVTGVLRADAGRISVGGYDIETDNIAGKMSFGFVPDRADAKVMREQGMTVPRGKSRETRRHAAGLTARHEVLYLLNQGLSNTEIADRLFVSPRTVENHVSAILTKLDATTRQEAVTQARDNDLIPSAAH